MRNLKIILGVIVFILAVIAGWQIGSSVLANVELQDDMRDLASQLGASIGYSPLSSDEDLRNSVIRKAIEHGIVMKPSQVTVQRMVSGDKTTIYLAADYTVLIHMPGFSFTLHFTPSSRK